MLNDLSTANAPARADTLHCQWCSVTLPAGQTVCPKCGSPGIPDPRLGEAPPPAAALPEATPARPVELVEWWREDEEAADGEQPRSRALPSYEEVERRRMMTLVFIGLSVVFCAVLGYLLGPVLAGPMEALTGTPVENTAELRPTGAFIGLLAGFMVGATGGWIVWSGR